MVVTDTVERSRRDLVQIFSAAVRAVDPARLVSAHLRRRRGSLEVHADDRMLARWRGAVPVVGAGKAAAQMASGCEASLGTDSVRGMVVVPDGCGGMLGSVALAYAAHPVPDQRAVLATEEICRLVQAAESPLLCLISGGASSLLVQPRPPVTLGDKVETTRLLLASGADIAAINTVRKHLSSVKGGGLLRLARPRPLVSLILSDVVGDDPSAIGSGPTAPDPTSFADAWAVLERAGLLSRVPDSVRVLLAHGMEGKVPETVKPGDPKTRAVANVVIGSNRAAVDAAAREAERLGYDPIVTQAPLTGETAPCARAWIARVKRAVERRASRRCCVVAGGETIVTLQGTGRGGRNQEFALALAPALAGTPLAVLSAGTDGIDGPTDAAGAFVNGSTLRRSRERGLDLDEALRNNDSYTFFAALGDLFRCGPTGTNVMDLKIALSDPDLASAVQAPVLHD